MLYRVQLILFHMNEFTAFGTFWKMKLFYKCKIIMKIVQMHAG